MGKRIELGVEIGSNAVTVSGNDNLWDGGRRGQVFSVSWASDGFHQVQTGDLDDLKKLRDALDSVINFFEID